MKLCSRCKIREPRTGGRYCKGCHAAATRKWRKHAYMTDEQRMKDNCRSYAGVYLRRGKIERKPCVKCGEEQSQMHHPDYSKPLWIVWLCRPCHLEHHRESE